MKNFIKKYEEQIRYLMVGGWNTLFGYLVFVGLYFISKEFIHYVIILILSYIINITNAYLCYKFFVFKTKGNYLKEYFRFYLVYGTAFLINLALLPLFVELFKIHPLIIQAIITGFTVIISYFGHKYFSFKKSSYKNS